MKKTDNISLGGYAFVIEEEAKVALENYLDNVRKSSSEDVREELVADIEERLAELFIERCGKGAVIDVNTVSEATGRIGMPEDPQAKDHGTESSESGTSSADGTSSAAADSSAANAPKTGTMKKRLFRDLDNRILGGVCSGAANWLGIDPVPIRIVAAILFAVSFFSGSWRLHHLAFDLFILYVILWAVIPAPKTVEDKCAAKGKPLHYDEFKQKAETVKDTLVETAHEASSAPLLKAFVNICRTFFGIVFILVGFTIVFGSILAVFTLPQNLDIFPWIHSFDTSMIEACLANPLIRWTGFAAIALLGIMFLYGGVMEAFRLTSPKWHPGLLIFLAWLVVTIACALLVAKTCSMYLPWTMSV